MRARVAVAVRALAVVLACAASPVGAQAVEPSEGGAWRATEDDFPHAVERARALGRLLFVDAWAPWCHTCVFFREHVLPNVQPARFAGLVDFATIDTERDANRAFVARYPMAAWPTFFLIDPRTGAVRWVGTRLLDARELEGLLAREGARYRDELAGKKTAVGPLERAEALRARGDLGGAVRAYEALLAGPKRGAAEGGALEGLVAIHVSKHDDVACAEALTRFAGRLGSAARAPALALGLGCIASSRDVRSVRALVALAEESLRDPFVLGDDRSTLFESLHAALRAFGETDRAHAIAERWSTFLEGAAAEGRTPAARAAFDAHRVLAALALGQPERALPAVEASARDLPDDYNPRVRRASLLRALGRDAEALEAYDDALARVQGPRRARVLEAKAELLAAGERHGDAAEALHEALVVANAIVDDARRDATVQRLAGRLAEARFRAFVAKPESLPPIVQVGDPVLRVRAVDVPTGHLGTGPFQRFVALMAEVMRKAPGVGLAAPQIGVPWRLFVFEDTEERMARLTPAERGERERMPYPFTVVANPTLREVGEERVTFAEGCLSVSGYAGLVSRARRVEVSGLDERGLPRRLELTGWPARIVQHETDHVNGTVYVDRMETRSFSTGENAKRFPLRARPKAAPQRVGRGGA